MSGQSANVGDVLLRLCRAAEAVEGFIMAQAESVGIERKLSAPQLMMLVRLLKFGAPVSVTRLKAMAYVGTNISYNVNVLVNGGYISNSKSNTDRRSIRLELTPVGKEIAEKVRVIVEHVEKSVGDQFSTRQWRELVSWTEMVGHTVRPTAERVLGLRSV